MCPNSWCFELMLKSTRPRYISSFTGLAPSDATSPDADCGTKVRSFCDAGLRQFGLIMLFETHEAPFESFSGCPVKGSVGSCKLPAGNAEKSPIRSALEGTKT